MDLERDQTQTSLTNTSFKLRTLLYCYRYSLPSNTQPFQLDTENTASWTVPLKS